MNDGRKKDVDALRGDIEQTRQRISGEIEAIGERLTPGHAREVAREKVVEARDRAVGNVRAGMIDAKNRAMANVRGAARRASDVGSQVPIVLRENPIPTAMVVVGTGWLVWEVVRRARQPALEIEVGREPSWGEISGGDISGRELSGGETSGSMRERARSVAGEARHKLDEARGAMKQRAGVMRERAGDMAHRGRARADQALHRSRNIYEENPIAFGAVCLFAGVGLGMLLPHTSPEDRVLGERRQRFFERAKHVAEEAKEVAIHSAKEGIEVARETAKRDAEERELIRR
ncbi:MAG: DUF3618 domain-containing protein [Sandaracinaceae bacterium]|nr:DUF3618 domain-containing protein [Sandaracinaceae bacterium]